MTLKIVIGQSSQTGPRKRNEDYAGIVTPENEQLAAKGAILAIADGVSGNAGGREVAEMTVRSVLSDYYATPDTWETHAALDKVLSAANRWVLAQSAAQRHLAGMATTLSLIVLRGRRYYLAHVGDTRIYRLRQGRLELLTTDHVWDRPDMRHVLKRAIGLDQHLAVDYADGTLQPGDLFALMSDGVWGVLGQKILHEALQMYDSPEMIADHLTSATMAQGGQDNASVIVARIEEIGTDNLSDLLTDGKHLDVPPRLEAGERLDDFEVLSLLHESRASLIYQVRNIQSGQRCVMKTLQPLLAGDTDSCQALLNEEWLAKRVISKYIPQVLPLTAEKRSKLYYVMSWHSGVTLQQRIDGGHHFTATETAQIGTDIYAAGVTLYRLLTRRYPYGEIEPFQHPRFGEPVPPTRYRPDIPHWLENIVLKAVARKPKARFETAEEILLALEHGELKAILPPARTPLIARTSLVNGNGSLFFHCC